MPSRISRTEQRKAMNQAVVLIALSLVIILAFFFLVLPFSLRIYEMIVHGGTTNSQNGDTIPPQTPILSPLPSATNSAQLVISGYGEAESLMELFQNGSKISETNADTAGSFFFTDIPFQDGENVLYVVSTDTSDNASESKKYTVVFDTTPPNLTVEQPQDGSVVNDRRNQLATINGASEKGVRIYVNGKLAFTNSDGGFSTTYQLQEGENQITVRAVDAAGNEAQQVLRVTYSP